MFPDRCGQQQDMNHPAAMSGDVFLSIPSCSLALHLLLGELMFVRQRLSSAWHDAGVSDSTALV